MIADESGKMTNAQFYTMEITNGVSEHHESKLELMGSKIILS